MQKSPGLEDPESLSKEQGGTDQAVRGWAHVFENGSGEAAVA